MNVGKLHTGSKISFFLVFIMLAVTIFVPIWRIEMDAPQYPEGLLLQIYSYKIAGQVDIINGINHYIGMRSIYTDDFIEFKVLPYIILFFALMALFTSILGSKKLVIVFFVLFVIFGILSMYDFWKWEYEYGHNLDPKAAIIVPGMSYQPPLIGFKQLLNFGTYSIPDIGGILMLLSGMITTIIIIFEYKILPNLLLKKSLPAILFVSILSIISCSTIEIDSIKLNIDSCDYCKMTISDGKFGAAFITKKGRTYKFDDIYCMKAYRVDNEDKDKDAKMFYVHDFMQSNELIPTHSSYFVYSEKVGSPMGGNLAAFKDKKSAEILAEKFNTKIFDWHELEK